MAIENDSKSLVSVFNLQFQMRCVTPCGFPQRNDRNNNAFRCTAGITKPDDVFPYNDQYDLCASQIRTQIACRHQKHALGSWVPLRKGSVMYVRLTSVVIATTAFFNSGLPSVVLYFSCGISESVAVILCKRLACDENHLGIRVLPKEFSIARIGYWYI
jgi:hypothetical protein